MNKIIKNALTEWFDNLFIFEFVLNLAAFLLTILAIICEIVFACYSDNLQHILINPFTIWLLVVFVYYGYQIVELIFKYAKIEEENM